MARKTLHRHEAVERHIRSRVASLSAGDPIESDAELAELFQISRMTVRQATQRLVAEGVIYRINGVGTFVGAPQVHRHQSNLRSFADEMALRGLAATSQLLSRETRQASKGESAMLRLSPRSKVLHLRFLGFADQQPMVIESFVLPMRFASLLDTTPSSASLREQLIEHGMTARSVVGTHSAEVATPEEAQLLQLPLGAALFVARHVSRTEDDQPVEITESRYAGSRFTVHVESDA
ncbi:GntR family transcriptional regulator [Rudaeicoccus suwonensis]|uniref:GntR family transcriptional regulator n=1 Tax=Rudaeicoccus suwonensis TaxID=657409 RepID=A0A561E7A8_9MICO|nr:GntR family transcriptional regulator [Rudaeicoccus suwonensis]TWE11507.1 GntR family transcriptional regulator [Rudaeicoccus suwonensis]